MVKLKSSFHHLVYIFWISCWSGATCANLASSGILPNVQRPDCLQSVAACVPLAGSECFGATLPYHYSAPGTFVPEVTSLTNVSEHLKLWSALRSVPQCWEVIQPLLCAVYIPRCQITTFTLSGHNISTTTMTVAQLPSRELCEVVQTPCRVIEMYGGWPDYLRCDRPHFNKGCSSEMLHVKYNTSSRCMTPLISTSVESSWYPNIDGCGLQCQNPMLTDDEHASAHSFVAVMGSISLFCTLFTVLTFILDWKLSSRYPVVILFFMNGCFLIANVGWMAQFIPGARRDIVCRADGTIRAAEPQIGASHESASCTIIFVLVYYFSMAGVIWFALLAYAWHLSFRAFGSSRDVIEGRRGHFHLLAWSFPLVLTIVCLAVTQVDGDSVSGVCFAANVNSVYRGGFVLVPVGFFAMTGLVFLIKGLVTLIRIQTQSPGLLSADAEARIRETIIRIGIFAFLSFLIVGLTFAVHAYIFINKLGWQSALNDYIVCLANSTALSIDSTHCVLPYRPNLVILELNMFAFFATGIVISLWVWQKSTFKAWKSHLKRLFYSNSSQLEVNRINTNFDNGDLLKSLKSRSPGPILRRSSMSIIGMQDDVFGPKFDLTSISSREFSSLWSAALPYIVARRSRAPTPTAYQPGRLQRRHSDSDLQSITSIWTQMSLNDPANVLHGRVCDFHQRASLTSSKSKGIPEIIVVEPGEIMRSDVNNQCGMRRNSRRWHRRYNRIGPTSHETPDPSLVSINKKKVRPKNECKNQRHVCRPFDERLSKMFATHRADEPVAKNLLAEFPQRNSVSVKCRYIKDIDMEVEKPNRSNQRKSSMNDSKTCISVHAENHSFSGSNGSSTVAADVNPDELSSNGDAMETRQISETEDEAKSDSSEGLTVDETDLHSTSNYSIASSDTAALSIRLDENYEPIDPQPLPTAVGPITKSRRPPAAKAVVRPMDSTPSSATVPQTCVSLPKMTMVGPCQSNCGTQTSTLNPKISPKHQVVPPPPPPHLNAYHAYCYGNYSTPQISYGITAQDLPSWPPYVYFPPPPPPWVYHNPYYDIPPCYPLPAAPPYCGLPYDFIYAQNESMKISEKSFTTTNANVQPGKVAGKPESCPVRQDSSLSANEKDVFKPKAADGQFVPSIGSLFKPISYTNKKPAIDKETKFNNAYSRSLLEMVELVTPNFDTASSDGNMDCEDNCIGEIDDERITNLEVEEEHRLRIRRRHTRQWIRALQTDFEGFDNNADTSV